MARCVVSFLGSEGIRHTVEMEADTLYEAAARAIRVFKDNDCEPGLMSQLDVEIRTSIIHTITPKKVREWLGSSAKSPRDSLLKDRLREIL